jgi:hypothetical protein
MQQCRHLPLRVLLSRSTFSWLYSSHRAWRGLRQQPLCKGNSDICRYFGNRLYLYLHQIVYDVEQRAGAGSMTVMCPPAGEVIADDAYQIRYIKRIPVLKG